MLVPEAALHRVQMQLDRGGMIVKSTTCMILRKAYHHTLLRPRLSFPGIVANRTCSTRKCLLLHERALRIPRFILLVEMEKRSLCEDGAPFADASTLPKLYA